MLNFILFCMFLIKNDRSEYKSDGQHIIKISQHKVHYSYAMGHSIFVNNLKNG